MLFYNPYSENNKEPDNKRKKSFREEWHMEIRKRTVDEFPVHKKDLNYRLGPKDLQEKGLLYTSPSRNLSDITNN